MTQVWGDSPATGGKLLVLLALADFADDEGRCWPSIATIATKARLTERQTRRVLAELDDLGEIGMPSGARSSESPFIVGGQNVRGRPCPPGEDICGSEGGTFGVARVEPSLGTVKEPPLSRPTATQLEAEAMQRCWEHWLAESGKKQRLDDKRRRILRRAIQLAGEDRVKLALTGLTRSPHHRGQNEQHREYMEIRYALKGIGDESDDERIDKAILWGALNAPGADQVNPDLVQRWLDDVRWTIQFGTERERGKESWQKLRNVGFEIQKLDKAPWAQLSR